MSTKVTWKTKFEKQLDGMVLRSFLVGSMSSVVRRVTYLTPTLLVQIQTKVREIKADVMVIYIGHPASGPNPHWQGKKPWSQWY